VLAAAEVVAALAGLAAPDRRIRLRGRPPCANLGVASAAASVGCGGGGSKQTDGGAAPGSRCWPRGCRGDLAVVEASGQSLYARERYEDQKL
jgi:hypothetical protein